jgi:hypothetical protein
MIAAVWLYDLYLIINKGINNMWYAIGITGIFLIVYTLLALPMFLDHRERMAELKNKSKDD